MSKMENTFAFGSKSGSGGGAPLDGDNTWTNKNRYESIAGIDINDITIKIAPDGSLGFYKGNNLTNISFRSPASSGVNQGATMDYVKRQIAAIQTFRFKAIYDVGITYEQGDLVLNNAGGNPKAFLSIVDNNIGNPLNDENFWVRFNISFNADNYYDKNDVDALLVNKINAFNITSTSSDILGMSINSLTTSAIFKEFNAIGDNQLLIGDYTFYEAVLIREKTGGSWGIVLPNSLENEVYITGAASGSIGINLNIKALSGYENNVRILLKGYK